MGSDTFAVFDFENPSSMILTLLEDDMPFLQKPSSFWYVP